MQLIAVDMDGTCLNSRSRISRRALSLLCQRLAIPRSQVGCIGDSDNDLSMFEASGFGCAMNNASSKLLEKADYITRQDLDHDGAAEALEVLLHRNG